MSWVTTTRAAWIDWLGATPPPTDDQATRALTLALAAVETWLDRPLEKAERTQEDFSTDGVIRLRAWPVDTVTSVVPYNGQAVDLTHLYVDKRTGRMAGWGWGWGWGCGGPVTTVYTGGFDPMPVDLEQALWSVAAAIYPTTLASSAAELGGAVRRISTPDVGMIEYSVGGSVAGGGGDRLLGATLSPAIDSLLARYRAESVIGGA